MAKFEVVSRFAGCTDLLPVRKTAGAAGYDLMVAEDIVVPSYEMLSYTMNMANIENGAPLTLQEVAANTKALKTKPTLVSTGLKCQLDEGTYLELSVRSSSPLKYWLILANGVGVIDADYYNNPNNEGEIFLQVINLSPWPIQLKKGDTIGQAIVKPFLTIENDMATGQRLGGFGSTGNGYVVEPSSVC